MLLYCLARSIFNHLTPKYDADIQNVALYWHFMLGTAVITVLVTTLFPLAG